MRRRLDSKLQEQDSDIIISPTQTVKEIHMLHAPGQTLGTTRTANMLK